MFLKPKSDRMKKALSHAKHALSEAEGSPRRKGKDQGSAKKNRLKPHHFGCFLWQHC